MYNISQRSKISYFILYIWNNRCLSVITCKIRTFPQISKWIHSKYCFSFWYLIVPFNSTGSYLCCTTIVSISIAVKICNSIPRYTSYKYRMTISIIRISILNNISRLYIINTIYSCPWFWRNWSKYFISNHICKSKAWYSVIKTSCPCTIIRIFTTKRIQFLVKFRLRYCIYFLCACNCQPCHTQNDTQHQYNKVSYFFHIVLLS